MAGDSASATAPKSAPRSAPRSAPTDPPKDPPKDPPRHRATAEAVILEPALFEVAATGEESTAQALAALPELEWRVFRDVHLPGRRYANIDHVVVGPGGVFVIDSKAWAGDIEVAAGVLRHNGHRRERHVLAALEAAAAIGELVPGLDPATVKPVLCFDREQPVFGWSREVMVCSTVNVATLLTSRPRILDTATLRGTAEALAHSLRAATDPVVPIPPKHQVPPKDRRAHAAKRHQNLARSVVTILTLGTLAVLVLAVGVPWLASVVEDKARDRGTPALALGETVTVKGNPVRPELRLSVDRLRPTSAVGAKTGSAPVQLMAATVTIHNVGRDGWSSGSGTKFALLDKSDFSHPRSTGAAKVAAGRMLPMLIKVKPGQTMRGIVVFGVPRGVRVASVRITVGPGYPKAVRWSVD
jgi:Nuclease-related domain